MKTDVAAIITNWQPSRLDVGIIQVELTVVLGTQGFLALGIPEVREPYHEWRYYLDERAGWHQDNNGAAMLLAMWSNRFPTEVRFRNNRKLRAQDGDVIVIANELTLHRRPPQDCRRWFARTAVRIYAQ